MNQNTDEANKPEEQPQSTIHEAGALTSMLVESDPEPDPWLAIRRWGESRNRVKSSSQEG